MLLPVSSKTADPDPGFFSLFFFLPPNLGWPEPNFSGRLHHSSSPSTPGFRTDSGDKTGRGSLGTTGLQSASPVCPRTLVSGWHLGNMNLRAASRVSRPWPSPPLLLLGLLLLPAAVALTSGEIRSKAGGPGDVRESRNRPGHSLCFTGQS